MKDQSLDSLIANKFLHTAVRNFLNNTGYTTLKAQCRTIVAASAASAEAVTTQSAVKNDHNPVEIIGILPLVGYIYCYILYSAK